jgi:hypothetical protein
MGCLLLLLLWSIIAAAVTQDCGPARLTVREFADIRAVRDAARCPGAVVTVDWQSNLVLDFPIFVNTTANVTIIGTAVDDAVLDGNAASSLLIVYGTLDLVNITLQNGFLANYSGGAFAAADGSVVNIRGCNFIGNEVGLNMGGGAVYSRGSMNIYNSTFSSNFADNMGGQ